MSTPTLTGIPVGAGMPPGAIPAAICVLIYSFMCWFCGILLITTLLLNKERWSYVLLFAITTTCSSTVAITQQIYYMAEWSASRVIAFQASVAAAKNPALALGPLSRGFSSVTYWIQVFFFNVDALLMLFWAVALTFSVWDWRIKGIYNNHSKIGFASKIAAFVLPALVASLRASTKISVQFGIGFFLTSCLLFTSFTFGAICVILILVKYIRTRMGFSSYASGSVTIEEIPSTANSGRTTRKRSRLNVRVDPWLVVRFTIAFFILSGFNIFLVFYSIGRYRKILRDGSDAAPDFSTRRAVSDVLNYIPPVTASLLAFLLFGTTSQARAKYASIFRVLKCCGPRRVPTPSRIRGSSIQDWDPLNDPRRDGGESALTKSPTLELHEMQNKSMDLYPPPTPDKDDGMVVTRSVYPSRYIPDR